MSVKYCCPDCDKDLSHMVKEYNYEDTVSCPYCGEVITLGDLIEKDE